MSENKPPWTVRLGEVLERVSHDVFDVFRWMVSVGAARYIALKTDSALFHWVSYGLSGILFLFLMAVFMLRGQITLLRADTAFATTINLALNMLVCFAAFAASIWLVIAMVDTFILYQER